MKVLRSKFWVRSVFFTLLQRCSLFLFGAFTFIVLVRAFSKETFAAWALYLVIFSLFEVTKQGLLRGPTIKFLHMPEYAGKASSVRFASLFLNAGLSFVVIILILLFSEGLAKFLNAPLLESLLMISIVQIILYIPFHHFEILLTNLYAFKSIFWANLLRQAIFFVGVLLVFLLAAEKMLLTHVLWIQMAGVAAGMIVLAVHAKQISYKSYSFNLKLILSMMRYGKYSSGTNLLAQVSRNLDHFLTANLLGPLAGKVYVAYYNTVSRIGNMVDVPSLAAADVMFPKSVEVLETKGLEKVKYYSEKMIATILALILPLSIFIFIFPKPIIYLIAGPSYYPAIPILQITILFSMVRPLSYQFGATMDAIGKPKINFAANLLFLFISVLLHYFFIIQFGGIGGAYAIAVFYCISAGIMIYLLKRYTGVELLEIVKYTAEVYKDLIAFFLRKMGMRK